MWQIKQKLGCLCENESVVLVAKFSTHVHRWELKNREGSVGQKEFSIRIFTKGPFNQSVVFFGLNTLLNSFEFDFSQTCGCTNFCVVL